MGRRIVAGIDDNRLAEQNAAIPCPRVPAIGLDLPRSYRWDSAGRRGDHDVASTSISATSWGSKVEREASTD